MAANANLHKAKNAKNDEFYTQLTDVSKELMHYKQHFKDKVVFCNCDDPTWSAFWKYFHLNFEALGLKKMISIHYDKTEPTYKMEYTDGNDDKKRRRQNQWEVYLCEDNNQTQIEPIDFFYPMSIPIDGCMNSPKDTMIKGVKKYARLLIRRKAG